MDWHQLHKKKVTELRGMAKKVEGIGAVSGLNKDQLVAALAAQMGIEKPHAVVEGIDKTRVKADIRALKVKRTEALAAKDGKAVKQVRRTIRRKKRALRRAAHLTT